MISPRKIRKREIIVNIFLIYTNFYKYIYVNFYKFQSCITDYVISNNYIIL